MEFKFKGSTGIKEGVKFSKNNYIFSGSKVDRQFSFSKLDNHFNNAQKPDKQLKTAVSEYKAAFGNAFPTSKTETADLSAFGAGSIPLPPNDLGIGISAGQLQRQAGETAEHHIARITTLINSVTAAMLAHAEEQKSRQRQNNRPKIRR